ncbi:hypothetical protein [Vulcanococcus sp.]
MSGTVEIVKETARLRDENAGYDAWMEKLNTAERLRGLISIEL